MARNISRAEAWERAHEVFSQVNFNAFDFNTIKESLLDYVKLYYPEDFNDYIESSEFIAILELFAYVGELLAYRLDVNAHENFITTAERKESVLRLAKLISYKASRNIAARGLTKMTSIQTTETVFDSGGANLAGRRIFWNDPNNPNWKEQFLLVINRVLEQQFGSVTPNERVQVDNVLFELYSLNNNSINNDGRSVIGYSAVTGRGDTVPMELVPTELTESGPVERRPELNAKFTLLFANDGLGDGSDTTGFLMFTKQGTLAFQTQTFDGITPNQTFDLNVQNVNETDVWLNNVDPSTGEILTNDPFADILPHLVSEDLRFGEWIEVDVANARNIIFNTNKNRHKFEVEALDDDRIRLIFGDGEFSDIPSGTFQVWYRTSANLDLFVEQSSVVDKNGSFTYNDATGSTQTVSFTFSLISSLQNASASEDIDHIRRVAPSVYYSQDRMVNGRDYNTFMLQDPSILRLRAINRTFAGDSKYIAWHDPSENYENVKIFGDDLALYWLENEIANGSLNTTADATSEQLLENSIEPLLSSTDIFAKLGPELEAAGRNPSELRRSFNDSTTPYLVTQSGETNERAAILSALDTARNDTSNFTLYYSVEYDAWTVGPHECDVNPFNASCTLGSTESIPMIRVGFDGTEWNIMWRTRRLVSHSEETRFWNTNGSDRIISFNTLNSVTDKIVVVEANKDGTGRAILDGNLDYGVLGQELVTQNLPDAGLPDIHRLSVLPVDQNGDGIPDNLLQETLFRGEFTYVWGSDPSVESVGGTGGVVIDIEEAFGRKINTTTDRGLDEDVDIFVNGVQYTFEAGDLIVPQVDLTDATPAVATTIEFTGQNPSQPEPVNSDTVRFVFKNFVYFSREDRFSSWEPRLTTDTIRTLFVTEDTTENERLFKREEGLYPLNFAWFHFTPRLNLIDPAATNIIDIFIVTVGYFRAIRAWLANQTDIEPTEPTPLELRSSYQDLLNNKMVSDTVILHPGKFKILFGTRAAPQLRCRFKVIRPESSSLTDNQVKVRIVNIVRRFFDLDRWDFGETFYFTELAASIHAEIGPEIDSIVLVPTFSQNQFGDLFQVQAREDELFIPDINTIDIDIVQSFTPDNLRQ